MCLCQDMQDKICDSSRFTAPLSSTAFGRGQSRPGQRSDSDSETEMERPILFRVLSILSTSECACSSCWHCWFRFHPFRHCACVVSPHFCTFLIYSRVALSLIFRNSTHSVQHLRPHLGILHLIGLTVSGEAYAAAKSNVAGGGEHSRDRVGFYATSHSALQRVP